MNWDDARVFLAVEREKHAPRSGQDAQSRSGDGRQTDCGTRARATCKALAAHL
jgi:hypothetical protein